MTVRRIVAAALPVALAAGIGGVGSRNAPETYARLRKPAWAPPAQAFGPVWTALYVLIGIAGDRIERRGDHAARRLHLAQLALNGAWPHVFFARGRKTASVAVIAALDAVLAAEIVRLARTDRTAAALLSPYLAWTGFATALNASVSEP